MKKTLMLLPVLAALALTGCSAGNQSSDTTPSGAATPGATVSTEISDTEAAKAAAIESGRPESAWDKKCIAWETPSGNGDNQDWANELGSKWLDSHNGAGCPDAIAWPSYYVESWGSSQDGELIFYAEDTESTEWVSIAQDAMCKLSDEESLESVRVLTLSGEAKAHWGRSEMEKTSVC
ncbi:hypothetical protein ACLQ8T_06315 [Glutamicibacter sp. FR1]|uniref:hypothetical protein n=1 Tax=Glutamicibacter sp. FR1 TaxID=3393744 RepID=UPI0039AF4FCE